MIFAALLLGFSVLAFVHMCGTKEERLQQYSAHFGLAALVASVVVYLIMYCVRYGG